MHLAFVPIAKRNFLVLHSGYAFGVIGGTPLGFRLIYPPTQGSLALLRQKHFGGQATLGWRAQSRWDCRLLSRFGWGERSS